MPTWGLFSDTQREFLSNPQEHHPKTLRKAAGRDIGGGGGRTLVEELAVGLALAVPPRPPFLCVLPVKSGGANVKSGCMDAVKSGRASVDV